jgi:hypothetical protein
MLTLFTVQTGEGWPAYVLHFLSNVQLSASELFIDKLLFVFKCAHVCVAC